MTTISERPLWFWCTLCAVTMSLGWGLRGSIGGGSLGAMIPGAMIGLVLCLLLGREPDAGRIAAFAAVGVGFGGQETYGQTVGLSQNPETFWWAILGFALKGAAWGLLGGAFLGIVLAPDRVTTRRLMAALVVMVAGTWLAWRFIDHPKLMYFSNRLDRPREEVWAGLWLGGLLLLAVLRSRIAWWFALSGAIGGGIGFAFGASLQPWGKGVWPTMPVGWWKAMEFTFGALLGLSYGICAWRLRDELRRGAELGARGTVVTAVVSAAVASALAIVVGEFLPVRYSYTAAGAALLAAAWVRHEFAWQTAITATFVAFVWDALDKVASPGAVWAWAVLAVSGVAMAALVTRISSARTMLMVLTWTAVASSLRYFWPVARGEAPAMIAMFALLACAMTAAMRPGRKAAAAQTH